MVDVLRYTVLIVFVYIVTLDNLSVSAQSQSRSSAKHLDNKKITCPKVPKDKPASCKDAVLVSECKDDLECFPHRCCEQPCGNMICTESTASGKSHKAKESHSDSDSKSHEFRSRKSRDRKKNKCPKVAKKRPEHCKFSRFASDCQDDTACFPYKCCEQPCGNMMCNKPKCPAVKCSTRCTYGFETDDDGCPTCRCKPDPITKCPLPKCLPCSYGYVYNKKGCQTCECLPSPCKFMVCDKDETCEVEQVKCIRAPCHDRAVCVPKQQECPLPKCMPCSYGYAYNKEGCQTCKCLPNPCQFMVCDKDETCEVEQVECIRAPCPARAVCVPKKQRCPEVSCSNKCSNGFAKDKDDCQTSCTCNPDTPAPKCGPVCLMYCEHGNVKDANGCPICKCNPDPKPRVIDKPGDCPPFTKKCPTTNDGCQSDGDCLGKEKCCQVECGPRNCTKPVCKKPSCSNYCAKGYASDKDGCETCTCNPDTPSPVCKKLNCSTIYCSKGFANDKDGCPTCDCIPETPNPVCKEPSCSNNCSKGFAKDKNGCPTCNCNPETPTPVCIKQNCSNNCAKGFANDKDGCPTCTCKPDTPTPVCKKPSCSNNCSKGYANDKDGCSTCNCNPETPTPVCRKPICSNYCSKDYAKDKDGCPTCICNPETPTPVCKKLSCAKIYCSKGIANDKDGCPTCDCNPETPVCKKVSCTNQCSNGLAKDKNGCETCACNPDTHPKAPCPQVMCVVNCTRTTGADGCPACVCKQRDCPPLCKRFCQHGNVKDKNGCPVCECKPAPKQPS